MTEPILQSNLGHAGADLVVTEFDHLDPFCGSSMLDSAAGWSLMPGHPQIPRVYTGFSRLYEIAKARDKDPRASTIDRL